MRNYETMCNWIPIERMEKKGTEAPSEKTDVENFYFQNDDTLSHRFKTHIHHT